MSPVHLALLSTRYFDLLCHRGLKLNFLRLTHDLILQPRKGVLMRVTCQAFSDTTRPSCLRLRVIGCEARQIHLRFRNPTQYFIRTSPLTNSSRPFLRLAAHHRRVGSSRLGLAMMLKDDLSERIHELNKE